MDEGGAMCSLALVWVNWGGVGAVSECLHGVAAGLRTHYTGAQRSKRRRAMNRLARAQITTRLCVFLFSPR
jgi:hypothetical protein